MVDIDIVRLPFIQDALETFLCSYRYIHTIRTIKISITLQGENAEMKLWVRNYNDDSPGPAILDPNISPSLDRLVRLVESLRLSHSKLETFWFDFGTTSLDLWSFRYPAEHDTDNTQNSDAHEGVTTRSIVKYGNAASFTFWQRNVERSVGWE